MKLIDAKGKRKGITVQKYFAELFPNLYTWDELVKEYNIPMGSIGYLLKKGKDKPSDQVIINIDKVIIRGQVIRSQSLLQLLAKYLYQQYLH